jgi:hypothetical protein
MSSFAWRNCVVAAQMTEAVRQFVHQYVFTEISLATIF